MSDIQRWTFWLGKSRRKWLTAAIFRDLGNGVCLSELKEWNCEWISLNFQFSGELVPKKDHLTLFLRFKCSNGKTDSLKSENLQFLRRSSQLLKPWFETELSFCSFIETSPTIEVPSTSTTCCCRQINFQLLISEFWENQILRSPREKIFSLTLTFFLLCVGYFGQPANILHLRLFCRINNKNTTL